MSEPNFSTNISYPVASIGNALTSVSIDHIVADASDIYDKNFTSTSEAGEVATGGYQSELNQYFYDTISGIASNYLQKSGGDITGALLPNNDNIITLGTSTLRWKGVYAAKFIGDLDGNAATANYADALTSNAGSTTQPIYFKDGKPEPCSYTIQTSVPSGAVFTDTKNTAGTTNSASKLFLIGATSQNANPQTYSNSKVYATDGDLVANSYSGTLKPLHSSDVNTSFVDTKAQIYTLSGCDSTVSTDGKRYAGAANSYGFPVANNANAMLWIGAHSGNFGHQLGFSSDGRIYDRYISNGAFPETVNGGSWKKIAFIADIPNKFTGTAASHDHTFTGNTHDHTFTGTETNTTSNTLSISYDKGKLTITTSHTHSVTPTGTINEVTATGTISSKSLTPSGTISVSA